MIPARRNGNGLDIFDEVFADPFFGEKENKIMKTDLKEKDGKYMLEIDVPGYDKEDIKIELNEGYLTVSAEKNEEKEDKDKHAKYLKRERFTGMCSRSYYVGESLKEEDIKASFKNGILSIEFPKEVEKKVEEKKYIPIGE
ncbi:MAG: heat-shock protein Hsp20 [Clostridium sp. 26_21]|nr:MAG: heat-shock protein Hsp20 [Clostridium sp. 26_21]